MCGCNHARHARARTGSDQPGSVWHTRDTNTRLDAHTPTRSAPNALHWRTRACDTVACPFTHARTLHPLTRPHMRYTGAHMHTRGLITMATSTPARTPATVATPQASSEWIPNVHYSDFMPAIRARLRTRKPITLFAFFDGGRIAVDPVQGDYLYLPAHSTVDRDVDAFLTFRDAYAHGIMVASIPAILP